MRASSLAVVALALSLAPCLGGDNPPKQVTAGWQKNLDALIMDLIKSLESKQFDERERATRLLIDLGQLPIALLKKVIRDKPSLELSVRAHRILSKLTIKGPRHQIRNSLLRPVNLDRGIDPNTPFKDAIEFLADRYDLTIIINTPAFEDIGIPKVEEQAVDLPKMVGVPLKTVLRLLLAQIKNGKYEASFVTRHRFIEITTNAHTYSPTNAKAGGKLPRVDVDVELEPLENILKTIAFRSGANVVLDPRVELQARRLVTATMGNTAVDTAVRVVANMAGLKVVSLDNVLYVTTKENARELEADTARTRTKARQEKPKPESAPQPRLVGYRIPPPVTATVDPEFHLGLQAHPDDCRLPAGVARRLKSLGISTGEGK